MRFFPFRARRGPGGDWPPTRLLLALGLLLAGALLGFVLAFPEDALRERIEHEAARRGPVALRLASLSLAFPPALRADGVEVGLDRPRPQALLLDAVTVRPLWLSLFGGNPGVAFRVEEGGGRVAGTAHREGELAVEGRGVPFALPVGPLEGVAVAGLLGESRLVSAQGAGEGELLLEGVRITGLEAAGIEPGSLSLGRVTLRGTAKGKSLKLETVAAEGGDLRVSGGGTLTLAEPLGRSRVALSLTLTPGETLDDGLGGLLSLLGKPGRDGGYRLRVAGTLEAPRLQ